MEDDTTTTNTDQGNTDAVAAAAKVTADAAAAKVTADAAAAKTIADAAAAKLTAEGSSDQKSTLLGDGEVDKGKVSKEVPDAYGKFTMPEGMEFESVMLSDFSTLAKSSSLTQIEAQNFIDIASKHVESIQASQTEQAEVQGQTWIKGLKEDKEFGGEKFGETCLSAKRALKRFGSDNLKTFLDKSGLGNNDELVKLLSRVDKATAEDTVIEGAPPGDGGKKSAADVLYPPKTQ